MPLWTCSAFATCTPLVLHFARFLLAGRWVAVTELLRLLLRAYVRACWPSRAPSLSRVEAKFKNSILLNGFSPLEQVVLIQVAVTRLGLGMWQTITILQCPPRQTLLPDPTVKT